MDDFELRLDDELSSLGRTPLAEPEPLDALRRRARRVQAGRTAKAVTAVAMSIALVGAVVVARSSSGSGPKQVSVYAPGFVLGDVDAVVLSSTFDADGARAPISSALAARVAAVPGVRSVSGVLDTFAPLTDNADIHLGLVPPRTAILFSFHRDDDVSIVDGRAPQADDEIVVDADFLARKGKQVGDSIELDVRGMARDLHIVGTFELPGVDLAGIPMAAMSAAYQPADLEVDRIDVNLAPGTNAANVRDRIARALGTDYTVVPPSTISFADQRLAQVDIQRAYWALLSPDNNERSTSGVGASDPKEKANYAKYADLAKQVELRVENVTFLSPDAAALTFRIYYGGRPSPIITDPQTGAATRVDGHWQLGTSTLCSLAALVSIKCEGEAANVPITPPNGYESVGTLDPEIVHAFTVLTDPHSTADQRVAVVDHGAQVRAIVAAGVAQDAAVEKSDLTIAGWQQQSDGRIRILYSLQTTGGPSTPWPSNATANKGSDGHWRAATQYACGIQGVASGGCYSVTDTNGTPLTIDAAPVSP